MNRINLILGIIFALVFLSVTGAEANEIESFFPYPEKGEVITYEKDYGTYIMPLGQIVRGNLAHPEDEMPRYSVALQGIPLTGLAYITPSDYLIREGEVEKITHFWESHNYPQELFNAFKKAIEAKGAEIIFGGEGESFEKWANWYSGFYPLEKRDKILKSSQNHFFLGGRIKGSDQEKFFSLAVFQGETEEGNGVFSQFDLVNPDYGELVKEMEGTIPELMDYFDVPGVAIALIEEGEVKWEQAFGYADLENEISLDLSHVFRVGSITKPVLAWGVMSLIEQGKVNLDDPIENHLTRWEFPESKFSSEEVTIRRMLSHTAGLPGGIGGGFDPGERLPSLEEILSGETGMSRAEIIREPGSRFLYSNPGYVLLELLIEEVSGENFAGFARDEILLPLGMRSSTFSWDQDLQEKMATGYLLDGKPAPLEIDAAKGPGGLYSTIGDISRFLLAGISPRGERVLGEDYLNLMFSPQTETTSFYNLISDYYGLGYYLETLPTGESGISHGGQHTGWLTSFFGVPETGDGIVILTNSERSQHLIGQILGMWAEGEGYESVKMSRTYSLGTIIIQVGVLVILIISIFGIVLLTRGLLRKERHFAPFSPLNWPVRVIFILGFFILWGPLFWVTGQKMVRVFLPVLSSYIGMAFLVGGLPLLMGAVFPRREGRNLKYSKGISKKD